MLVLLGFGVFRSHFGGSVIVCRSTPSAIDLWIKGDKTNLRNFREISQDIRSKMMSLYVYRAFFVLERNVLDNSLFFQKNLSLHFLLNIFP